MGIYLSFLIGELGPEGFDAELSLGQTTKPTITSVIRTYSLPTNRFFHFLRKSISDVWPSG